MTPSKKPPFWGSFNYGKRGRNHAASGKKSISGGGGGEGMLWGPAPRITPLRNKMQTSLIGGGVGLKFPANESGRVLGKKPEKTTIQERGFRRI